MTGNIGLVGPMSNYAAPPQLVESVPYRSGRKRVARGEGRGAREPAIDIEEVANFAMKFHEEHSGKWMEVERLGGFCLLIKRAVYKVLEQRGELEKCTDLSFFDTDILSVKARQAGYGLALCRDLFIHHFGTRIFSHGATEDVVAGSTVH